jgi:hypothetical protein
MRKSCIVLARFSIINFRSATRLNPGRQPAALETFPNQRRLAITKAADNARLERDAL